MHRWASIAMAAAALGFLAACGSSGHRTPVAVAVAVGHVISPSVRITVPATGPCPGSLGSARDVSRQAVVPRDRLLPNGRPSSGLICEYRSTSAGGNRLLHAVRLDATRAGRLASAVARVSLTPAKGSFSCPAGLFGSETVIAFAYPDRLSVDLWYLTSGCRTLDNGDVLADGVTHPSFYDGFESTFAALVPSPAP